MANHNVNDESRTIPETRLEQIKYHLSCAAEISEEVGLFFETADIKQVNAGICRMQGKVEDADKLDCSITELKKLSRTKKSNK